MLPHFLALCSDGVSSDQTLRVRGALKEAWQSWTWFRRRQVLCASARKQGRALLCPDRQGTDGSLPRVNFSPPLEGTLPPLSPTSCPPGIGMNRCCHLRLQGHVHHPPSSAPAPAWAPLPLGARLRCALTRGKLESRCPWRTPHRRLGLGSRSPAGVGGQDRGQFQRSLGKLEPPPRPLPPLPQTGRVKGRRPFQTVGSWPQEVASPPFWTRHRGPLAPRTAQPLSRPARSAREPLAGLGPRPQGAHCGRVTRSAACAPVPG